MGLQNGFFAKKALSLLLVWLVSVSLAYTQEMGVPFLNYFGSKQYEADPANWAITQSPNGMLYVGNSAGLLEYDGHRWKLYTQPNGTFVRSLAWDSKGNKLFAGGQGEIGYFQADQEGKLTYTSLLPLLDSAERNIVGEVWNTLVSNDTVFFHCREHLIRVIGTQATFLPTTNTYHRAAILGGRLYLNEAGKGLCTLQDDTLVPVPGGERFNGDIVSGMLELHADTFLIGTRKQGTFFYLPKEKRLLPTGWEAVNQWMRTHILYSLTWHPDRRIVASSTQRGILLIYPDGRIKREITKEQGLANNQVFSTFVDRQRNLWLGMGNGISRLEIQQPFRRHGDAEGLSGVVLSVSRNQGDLYVGTTLGMFVWRDEQWERIPGIQTYVWEIIENPSGTLWAACTDGLYEIQDGRGVRIELADNSARKVLIEGDTACATSGRFGIVPREQHGVSDAITPNMPPCVPLQNREIHYGWAAKKLVCIV